MNINLLLKATENWEQQPTFEDWDEMESIWMDKFGLVADQMEEIEYQIEKELLKMKNSQYALSRLDYLYEKEIDYSQDNIPKGWQILLNGYLNNTIIETLKKVQISAEEFYQTQYPIYLKAYGVDKLMEKYQQEPSQENYQKYQAMLNNMEHSLMMETKTLFCWN